MSLSRPKQIVWVVGITVLITSCAITDGTSTKLAEEFREAAKQERTISAQCLVDREKWGEARYIHDQQEGTIEMVRWVGTLKKDDG